MEPFNTLRPLKDTIILIAAIGSPIAIADVLMGKRKHTTISRIWWESEIALTSATWSTLTAHLAFRLNWPKSLAVGATAGSALLGLKRFMDYESKTVESIRIP